MRTPTTPGGLRQYDHLPPVQAALQAWHVAGADEDWHRRAQQVVRQWLPALAQALDECDRDGIETRLRRPVPPAVVQAMPLLARAAGRAR